MKLEDLYYEIGMRYADLDKALSAIEQKAGRADAAVKRLDVTVKGAERTTTAAARGTEKATTATTKKADADTRAAERARQHEEALRRKNIAMHEAALKMDEQYEKQRRLNAEGEKGGGVLRALGDDAGILGRTVLPNTSAALGGLSGAMKVALPLAAAMGGALLVVAQQAREMANELDNATRRAATFLPDLAGRMDEVKDKMWEIAKATGTSIKDLSEGMVEIARNGAGTTDELVRRLEVINKLSIASGNSVASLAGSYDQFADAFGLDAEDASAAMTKLFAIAQNRVPFEELLSAFQRGALRIREMGLDVDTASAAIATLMDQGLKGTHAVQMLEELALMGEEGAKQIRDLAAAGQIDGVQAMNQLEEAMAQVVESGDRLSAQIEARWQEKMEGFGRLLHGMAIGLKGLAVNLLDYIFGYEQAVDRVTTGFAVAQGLLVVPGGTPGTSGSGAPARGKTPEQMRKEQEAAAAAAEARKALHAFEMQLQQELAKQTNDTYRLMELAATQAIDGIMESWKALSAEGRRQSEGLRDQVIGNIRQVLAFQRNLVQNTFGGDGPTARTSGILVTNADLKGVKDMNAGFEEIYRTMVRTGQVKLGQSKLDKEIRAENEALLAAEREQTRQLNEQVELIGNALQGVLQLANAFGLVNDETMNVLNNVLQLGTSLPKLVNELGKLGQTDAQGNSLTSLTQVGALAMPVIGAASQLIGGIVSAFGESPEVKASRELQIRNTGALAALTDTIALLNSNLTGSEWRRAVDSVGALLGSSVRGPLGSILGPLRDTAPHKQINNLESVLGKLGTSFEELQQIAREYGIELDRSVGSFIQFEEALRRGSMATFGTTFGGGMQSDQFGRQIFGRDATAGVAASTELMQLMQRLTQFSGLGKMFDVFELDINTVEGRAEVVNRIFEIAKKIQLGLLTMDELGGLTGDEMMNALISMMDLIDTLDDLDSAVDDVTTTIAQSLNEVLAELSQSFEVFNVTDPVAQAQQFVDKLRAAGGAFAGLDEFDLTTISGRTAAEQAIQDLYRQWQDGTVELGDVTVDMLIRALGLMRQATANELSEMERQLAEQERLAADHAREMERIALEEARAAEAAAREEERLAREAQRLQEEMWREELRRLEEMERARNEAASAALRRLDNANELFGITDPIEQLKRLAFVVGKSSPTIGRSLAGSDLDTAEGRSQAQEAIRALFLANPDGRKDGLMSSDQFLNALLDLNRAIVATQDTMDVTGGGSSQSFAIDRSITETRGELITAYLSTGNTWLSEIAGNTALAASLLAAMVSAPLAVQPPFLPDGAGAGAGGWTLVVQVSGVGVDEGYALGADIGKGILERISAGLGSDYRLKQLLYGEVIR